MAVPVGSGSALPGSYATVPELINYPVKVPDGVDPEPLLRRASRDVDRALLTSVYDPTDPDVLAVLRDATCEQVAGMIDSGDLTGSGAQQPSSGFTLGRLSEQSGPAGSGSSGGGAARVNGLWDQAWTVLQVAGLTGHGVQTWGRGSIR